MKNKPPITIPMSYPDLTDAERQAVLAVVSTPNLSMGPQIEAFETAFRTFCGSRHAIGVNSGTAGLHLCVRAAGIGAGDYVITTPFSFVASANVLIYENAIPIFVDVDPLTGNINPALVQAAATDLLDGGGSAAQRWLPRQGASRDGKLKAILAVDVFGQPADLFELRKVTDIYNLRLIEDSCEALGAEYRGQKAGTLGDFGVFAFYPNKQITTGEGGMIITNDNQAADLMRALRNQGRAPGDTWLQHTYLGYNYRLDEMSAVLGVVQMSRLEELLSARQNVANWYQSRLEEIPGIEPPQLSASTSRVSWFVYVIRLDPDIDRSLVAERLAERGIPVRPYFLPIHLQPYMVERFGYCPGDFPVTEDLGRRGLALPFSGKMSERQVEQVCLALADCLH
ncbi:MAG: DegT/DnrJ/EryC1/StrS family aminotransferase [Anaerolineaceae bacterium]|nr:DegT/DnrJ/EryC1/StrS family aminotransferase [Anaerolineaceae bacterium]